MPAVTHQQQLSYRLLPPTTEHQQLQLSPAQQAVVEHPGGPLLVLAGPGTGKTTTVIEAIAHLIEERGVDPEQILALTFSRKAAEQLRDQVTARIGRTMATTMSSTFHSFAYGLIRAYAPTELYDEPLRLLSAPEQDVVLRELLRDNPEAVRWPESLRHAVGTRGFTKEVAAVLSRAREKGIEPAELVELGRAHDVAAWQAAGQFLEQYLTVLDAQSATDYPDLIRRAVIEAELHRDELRAQYTHVFVDEYQDTDPAQVALLQALAGDGRNLVVVGDPHQSIYAFRGAEVRGILDFPSQFPTKTGGRAPVIALAETRRFGERILAATKRIADRLSLTGSIDAEAREVFLNKVCVDSGGVGPGRVEVATFDTDRAEAEQIADLLRRAHLEDGIDWSRMAVLVRSGKASIGGLRRSLAAAGVPVEVAGDELPLMADPAALPLLQALRLAVQLAEIDPAEVALEIDHSQATGLLTGPLGGLDAASLRRLGRRLREREKEASKTEQRVPRTSRELLAATLAEPGFLDGIEGREASQARERVELLRQAAEVIRAGGSAHEVLWLLWQGTAWPQRLRQGVAAGGGAARRAHRDLDSLCALFEVAGRAEGQREHQGVGGFLEGLLAQQIPADTLAERGIRGSAVRLLTAHRSKGLQWDLVVVAHVQADGWPDLRRRYTLLGADRLGADGLVPPVAPHQLLMEERRLFYVACTRARRRLIVTAVKSPDEDGEQPSRFLGELGVTERHFQGRPRRPLSLAGVIADLRRALADPATTPALRAVAAHRLARLAGERSASGRQLAPEADPSWWWGTRSLSAADTPLRATDKPLGISASTLESINTCPARWFFEREAGGSLAAHQAANVGQIVHALAERIANQELAEDLDQLMAEVDAVWDRLSFRTPWAKQREHDRVRLALARFLRWHADNPRNLLGTEQAFSTEVSLQRTDGSVEQVVLRGFADRLELTTDGEVIVVDLKTGRTGATKPQLAAHVQLGFYQYAMDHGASPHPSGGAELVQLGLTGSEKLDATVQGQPKHAEDGPERRQLLAQLAQAVDVVRNEEFPATPSEQCKKCQFVAICPAQSAGSVIA